LNVKEYIASGIVESYVLGLASKEEMAEFERMCAAHSEVRVARDAFEKQLEAHALNNSIKPPAHLQSQIFSEIDIELDKLRSTQNNGTVTDDYTPEPAPVVTLRWWKYSAVAAIIFLLASVGLNIYLAGQYNKVKRDYTVATTNFADTKQAMQTRLTDYENSLQVLKDTNMAVIKMKGVSNSPESMATVYWDTRTKDVYLFVNNLPEPASGKQYQLWAIVDGKPVDAGMLNWNDADGVAVMKNIPAAQGFAITMEKMGGSPTPDMDAMYVMKML